jgi:hypothetical protein
MSQTRKRAEPLAAFQPNHSNVPLALAAAWVTAKATEARARLVMLRKPSLLTIRVLAGAQKRVSLLEKKFSLPCSLGNVSEAQI